MGSINSVDNIYDSKKKLYHYTNIEGLYYILKNKTIKFNSLKFVDDLEEQKSFDLNNFGQFNFVSCFTMNSEDLIPLWSLYSKGMTGVRIELPSDFFDYNIAQSSIISQIQDYNLMLVTSPLFRPIVGVKIEYTNNENEIFPKIWDESNKKYPLKLNQLGKHKRKIWSFEREVRYIIYTYPNNWYKENDSLNQAKQNIITFKNDVKSLFIPIKDDVLGNIKIVIGPRATEFEKSIIKLIAKNFGVKDNYVSESKLQIQ